MASIRFPSRPAAEVIDVEFLRRSGDARTLQLLVDSGFTGASSFVLGHGAADLVQAAAPEANASGALQGAQQRGWVTVRVQQLAFQHSAIAIRADTAALLLPDGVKGLAGLTFLRQFRRWGAEREGNGSWSFFLDSDRDASQRSAP